MKRWWAIAFAFLGMGCDAQPVVPIRYFDVRTGGQYPEETLTPEILTACDILGFDCHADSDDGTYGKIGLFIFEDPHSRSTGHSFVDQPCHKAAWSINDPQVIAHEIGHTFRLGHTDDPDNLMYPYIDEWTEFTDFDDDQLKKLHRRGDRFSWGCIE